MNALAGFRQRLEAELSDPYVRPFVCDGSPFACRSFVVGFNAATLLPRPFEDYWSDDTGFLRQEFRADYDRTRKPVGNRPRIEAIAKSIQPCLETNLYATPTKRAHMLPSAKKEPLIDFLFREIRPALVFVHSNEPIRYLERVSGCRGFTETVREAHWQGHPFLLFGRPGPLFRMGMDEARALGEKLAAALR